MIHGAGPGDHWRSALPETNIALKMVVSKKESPFSRGLFSGVMSVSGMVTSRI